MIKKIYINLLVVVLCATIFTSCRDLPQNGDFSGHWQIVSMEYPDGTIVRPAGTHYYSFYRSVAQLSAVGYVRVTGNLVYTGTEFSIEFHYQKDAKFLEAWGVIVPSDDEVEGWVEHYKINKLTPESLVMTTSQGIVITCRIY